MIRLIHLTASFYVSLLLMCVAFAQDATFLPQNPGGTIESTDPGAFQKLKVTGEKDSVNPIPKPKIMDQEFYKNAVKACEGKTGDKLEECVTRAMQDDPAVTTFLQNNDRIQISDDPLEHLKTQAMKNLETFLDKRLEETLYGDGMASVANHDTFYGLYQVQLGKLAIKIVTDFCMDLAPTHRSQGKVNEMIKQEGDESSSKIIKGNSCLHSNQFLTRRIGRNIPVSDVSDSKKKNCADRFPGKMSCETELDIVRSENLAYSLGKEGSPDDVKKIFIGCMEDIPHLCNESASAYEKTWKYCCSGDSVCTYSQAYPDHSETKTRACAVAANLRLLASRIAMMEELRAAIKKSGTGLPDSSFQASTVFGEKCVYGLGNCDIKPKTIDELTTLTSKELADEKDGAGLKKALDSEAKKIKAACKDDIQKNPSQVCLDLLYKLDHEKEIDKIEQEHNAKTRLVSAKIAGMKDPKEVEEYLLSEGMSKEQAEKFLQKFYDAGKSIDEIKAKIAETYTLERKNVIQSIRDQLRNKTYLVEPQKDKLNKERSDEYKKDYFYGLREAKLISKEDIKNITQEQARKGELVLAQQTFRNMVSSYFTLEFSNQDKGQPKEIFANPFDAKRELAGGYFVTDAGDKKQIEDAMQKRFDEKGIKALDPDKSGGGSTLPVDFIFGIIDGGSVY